MNNLNVGDKVYLRNDLKEYDYYGGDVVWVPEMPRGQWVTIKSINSKLNQFHIEEDCIGYTDKDNVGFTYNPYMIDWDKTMNTIPLNVGDRVYLRDDLKDRVKYGNLTYFSDMLKGQWVTIKSIDEEYENFEFKYYFEIEEDNMDNMGFNYDPEMIDWDKTLNTIPLNVGDRVYLRDDLFDEYPYGGKEFNESMLKGCWATIKYTNPKYSKFFLLEEDYLGFTYTPEMIDWDKTMNESEETVPVAIHTTNHHKPKLRFILKCYDEYLVFQILEQCDSITNYDLEDCLEYQASNSVLIISSRSPYITVGYYSEKPILHIGGYDSKTGTHIQKYDSPEQAEQALRDYLQALTEWKNDNFFHGKGYNAEITCNDGIYEL